jgi:signal peptidase
MNPRRLLSHLGYLLVATLVVGLIAGSLTGTPVFLSFVETGSMEPTLEAGDGFVAIPAPLAGEVQEGDVVVFQAQNLQGGGLTTHRVVGETEQGYITRGDANPFTDQDGSEPPVTEGQIRAKALQVGGTVVRIPNLGVAISAFRSTLSFGSDRTVGIASVAAGAGLLLIGLLSDGPGRYGRDDDRSRDREDGIDVRLLVAALTLVILVPLTASMVVPAGPQEYGIVSADRDTGADHVIEAGTTKERRYPMANGGVIPAYSSLEPASEGVAVDQEWHRLDSGATVNATVAITAPPETGYYVRNVVEYRYVAVLPEPLIVGLHAVHPWLPIFVINLLIGGGFYAASLLLVGQGRLRVRNRTRERA